MCARAWVCVILFVCVYTINLGHTKLFSYIIWFYEYIHKVFNQQCVYPISSQNTRLRRRGESLEQTLNAQLAEAQEKLRQAEEKIKEQLAELKLNSAAKVEEIQSEAKKEIDALRDKLDQERKVTGKRRVFSKHCLRVVLFLQIW